MGIDECARAKGRLGLSSRTEGQIEDLINGAREAWMYHGSQAVTLIEQFSSMFPDHIHGVAWDFFLEA